MDQSDDKKLPSMPSVTQKNDSQQLSDQVSALPTKDDQWEIIKFFREEAEASRKAQREEAEANRKAQREESNANRTLFLETSKIVAIPLAVLLTLAGVFFYHDLDTMTKAMERQSAEATAAEIDNNRKKIDKKIEDEFEGPIKQVIDRAAETATQTQAPDLIKQVITPEVKKAVDSQSVTIAEVAKKAAADKLEPLVAEQKLQYLLTGASSDSAEAFDGLLDFRKSALPTQRHRAELLISDLEQHALQSSYGGPETEPAECSNPGGPSYQALLSSSKPGDRKRAVSDCATYVLYQFGDSLPNLPADHTPSVAVRDTVAPIWVNAAFKETSLSVRASFVRGINELFRGGGPSIPTIPFPPNGFDLLDTTALRDWWKTNSGDQGALALLAFSENPVHDEVSRLDLVDLYKEVQKLSKTSPNKGAQLEQLLERMRSDAAQKPGDLNISPLPDCAKAEDMLKKYLKQTPGAERDRSLGPYAHSVMGRLMGCQVGPELLSQIAAYGISTRSLRHRYMAVELVNKNSGMSLDHYDAKPLQDWLKTHSQVLNH